MTGKLTDPSERILVRYRIGGACGFGLGLMGVGIVLRLASLDAIGSNALVVWLSASVFSMTIGGMLAILTAPEPAVDGSSGGGTGSDLGSSYDSGGVAAVSSILFTDAGCSTTGCH